jgi:hypothetical protein
MAHRRALPATTALALAAVLTFGVAGLLGMLEQPARDVPVLRWLLQGGPGTDLGLGAVEAAPVPSPDPALRTPSDRAPGPAAADPRSPGRSAPPPILLHIEQLGVSATVRSVGVMPDGGMEIPEDVHLVGWYAAASRRVSPGDPGTAVIAGHRDSRVQGAGALHDLSELEHGQRIEVVHLDGSVSTWQVDELLTTPRDELPTELLFARDGPPRLALVTCGGTFDRRTRSYSHNTIVVASPVQVRPGR